jgi:hypothetical protein
VSTQPSHIDVAPRSRLGAPHLALLLAVLAIPGSLLPWDWFALGGLVIGLPLALAAIVVGMRARRDGQGRAMATTAVAIGAAAVLIPVVWTTAALLG